MGKSESTTADSEDGDQDIGRAGLRRAAFMKAARDVFLEYGYEAANMSEIVKRAGGSLSTLYAQFGGKRGLFEAMIDARVAELTAQMQIELAAHAPLREGLTRIGEGFLSRVVDPESLDVFRLLVAQAKKFPDMVDQYGRTGPDRVRLALAEYLQDRTQAGEIRITDFEAAATIFLDLLRGRVYLRALTKPSYAPTEEDVRQTVDRAVKVFLSGVEALAD